MFNTFNIYVSHLSRAFIFLLPSSRFLRTPHQHGDPSWLLSSAERKVAKEEKELVWDQKYPLKMLIFLFSLWTERLHKLVTLNLDSPDKCLTLPLQQSATSIFLFAFQVVMNYNHTHLQREQCGHA